MQALDALLNRVSVPRLIDPAPTAEQREVLFGAAMRAPDHGHLQPWRFLTVEGAAHQVWSDDPPRVLGAIREFLKSGSWPAGAEKVSAP